MSRFRRHSDEYARLIDANSPEWQALRARRFQIDNGRCVYCGKPGAVCKKGLKIHHAYYNNDNLLDIKSVVTVCDGCHGILEGELEANKWKDGTPFKHESQYDPSTPEAKQRLKEYVDYMNALIDAGKV